MNRGWLFVIVILGIFFSCTGGPELPNDQMSIRSTINKTIVLLESKNYQRIFDEIVSPESLDKILSTGTSIEDAARQFGIEASGFFYEILLYIQDQEPVFSSGGSTAAFSLDGFDDGDFPSKLIFVKFDNRWYIEN